MDARRAMLRKMVYGKPRIGREEKRIRARARLLAQAGEVLQPLVTFIGPYSLHPLAPHVATVGLTDLHCEDQEQPDHAYQIAYPAHAYAAFVLGVSLNDFGEQHTARNSEQRRLPRGEREIFTP